MAVLVAAPILSGIRGAVRDALPHEACGLLFGDAHAITGFSVAPNVADDPASRFEIDPAALFAGLRAERAGGARVVGYWHSHPSGDAMPSQTDAAMAAPDGKLWLILGGAAVTCWRAGDRGRWGRFEAVELAPID